MARPNPTTILEEQDGVKAYQVYEADSVYAVYYQEMPVGIRTNLHVELPDWQGWKYARTAFTQSGHAFNLAAKLNRKFSTEDFNVRVMTVGRIVKEAV